MRTSKVGQYNGNSVITADNIQNIFKYQGTPIYIKYIQMMTSTKRQHGATMCSNLHLMYSCWYVLAMCPHAYTILATFSSVHILGRRFWCAFTRVECANNANKSSQFYLLFLKEPCVSCLIYPLINNLSKLTTKETVTLHVTGLCEGNLLVTDGWLYPVNGV